MLRSWKEERQVSGLEVAVQLAEGGEAEVVEAVYQIIGPHLINLTLQAEGELQGVLRGSRTIHNLIHLTRGGM